MILERLGDRRGTSDDLAIRFGQDRLLAAYQSPRYLCMIDSELTVKNELERMGIREVSDVVQQGREGDKDGLWTTVIAAAVFLP